MTVIREDRQRWAEARTLADLGELTAQWLEGRIASQPGYCGPTDVDDPDVLVPLLARLNRTGFVTNCSQHAFAGTGYDGAWWEQRAAVEGFIGDQGLTMRLADAASSAGLLAVIHDPAALPRWRYGYHKAVPVTTREDRVCTGFGCQLPRRHIRDAVVGYGVCSREAVDALCSAWQVTVIDPEWGRERLLWDVLARAAALRPGTVTT